ncbi:uncharacterized protein G2W53_003917 [Senna tora]|uniref:Uncharacterized protein n=1 Tax=Senna tora TaxID=362788 RepID=A0A835CGU4_9FABA|nr:uncharacterized protein G2W53_003917 [Senna tora]
MVHCLIHLERPRYTVEGFDDLEFFAGSRTAPCRGSRWRLALGSDTGRLNWKYEREWGTRVASKMSIDSSRMHRTSPFDAPVEENLPKLNSGVLEEGLASCPGSNTYGITGGDRGPLRVMHSDGVRFFMYLYHGAFCQSLTGRPWHFVRVSGAPAIFKGIKSKMRGWQESCGRKVVSPADSAQLTSMLGEAKAPSRLERSCLELLHISAEHHRLFAQVMQLKATFESATKEVGWLRDKLGELQKRFDSLQEAHNGCANMSRS